MGKFEYKFKLMKELSVYFIILLFISSCRPDLQSSDFQKGIVNGIVLDKTTNTGIPNAIVYLLGNEGGGTWGGGGTASFEIDQTVSDANGNFTFQFDYDDSYGYYCSAVAEQYFNYYEEVPVDNNAIDINNVGLLLNPIGYLSIHIINDTPYDENDEITLSFTYNGSYPEFAGVDVDTILCCFQTLGNENNRIVWYVEKNGIDTSFYEYVNTQSFDTTYFEILY